MKRYRLTIWFVVTALLSIAAASWGVGNIVRKESEANINHLTKEDAASEIALLRSYLESLREIAGTVSSETVTTVDDSDIAVLGLDPATVTFLLDLIPVLDVIGVNVFDDSGMPIFSSMQDVRTVSIDPEVLDKLKSGSEFESKLARGVETVGPDGEPFSGDLAIVYLPIGAILGPPIGGFVEVHRDVTADLLQADAESRREVWITTVVTMAGLFLVLVGFVIVANYRINRSAGREREMVKTQLAERRSAERALMSSNERLQATLDELHSTQEQAIRQGRMHELGLMASGIAHDLNNTLSPILGYSGLMLNHPAMLDDEADVRRMLELINTSAVDASEVIARMRQFYKIRADEGAFESVDLNDLVQQVVGLTKPNLQNQAQAKGFEIDVVTESSDVPAIQVSASEIREILINMVINAADAMPEGGTIVLRTRQTGRNVDIEVEDNGTGMSDETREQCFNIFFSTKGDRGNGLGLGVAQGTVRKHGGLITVDSELGKGTTFKISLPVAGTTEPKTPAEGISNGKDTHQSLNVLLIDDDPRGRDVIAEYLRADGHSVAIASDGAVGFETFCNGDFDIVLTDWAMPGMNGDRLASAVKSHAPNTPVVLLTGFGSVMDPDLDTPKDVDVLLSKPVSVEKVRDALARVIHQPLTTA